MNINIYNLIFTFLDDALELLKVLFPNIQALATGTTVLIILIRIYKKYHKQQPLPDMLYNQRVIMRELGVEGEWHGPTETSWKKDQMSLKPLFTILQKAAHRGSRLRRKNMGTIKQVNLVPMIVAILGAIKLVLQAFGYDMITDDQINAIANGIASIVAVVGVLLSNRKKGVTIGDRTDYSKSDDVGV